MLIYLCFGWNFLSNTIANLLDKNHNSLGLKAHRMKKRKINSTCYVCMCVHIVQILYHTPFPWLFCRYSFIYICDKFTQAQKCYIGIFDNAFYTRCSQRSGHTHASRQSEKENNEKNVPNAVRAVNWRCTAPIEAKEKNEMRLIKIVTDWWICHVGHANLIFGTTKTPTKPIAIQTNSNWHSHKQK